MRKLQELWGFIFWSFTGRLTRTEQRWAAERRLAEEQNDRDRYEAYLHGTSMSEAEIADALKEWDNLQSRVTVLENITR